MSRLFLCWGSPSVLAVVCFGLHHSDVMAEVGDPGAGPVVRLQERCEPTGKGARDSKQSIIKITCIPHGDMETRFRS